MIHSSFKKVAVVTLSALVLVGCGDTDSSNTTNNPDTDAPGLSAEVATTSESDKTAQDKPTAIGGAKTETVQAAGAKLPKGWETYNSQAGRFSIAMPGKPSEEERPVALPGGDSVPLKIASLEKRNVAYFTGYVDYPEGLVSNPAIDVQEILSSSIEGATAADFGEGTLTQNETSVNGVPCRNFKTSGKLEGQDARMEGVFCLEGDRLFEVLIIGADKSEFPQKAQDFMSSFEIKKS